MGMRYLILRSNTFPSNEALLSIGYSPFMNFILKDFDEALGRVMQMGATMDGPVLYPLEGKVYNSVCISHIISLQLFDLPMGI